MYPSCLRAADNEWSKKGAEHGIIFNIDEHLDKIAEEENSMSERDVSGESVQQGMLENLLEGSDVEDPVRGNEQKCRGVCAAYTRETRNILFHGCVRCIRRDLGRKLSKERPDPNQAAIRIRSGI